MVGLVAALSGATAVLLCWPKSSGDRLRELACPDRRSRERTNDSRRAGLLAVFAAAICGGLLSPWVPMVGLAAGAALVLVAKGRRDKRLRNRHTEVVAAAQTLAGLLRVGQLPTAALLAAATDHKVLRRAAAAAGLGGDVAGELASSAKIAGYEGVGVIAASWSISVSAGAPMSGLIESVADQLQSEERLRGEVATEVAGARATGRLLAVLPAFGVALGYIGGGDPIRILFNTEIGQVLCLIGVLLSVFGVFWMERLADRAMLGGPRW